MKLFKFSKPGCMPCVHLSHDLEEILPEEYPYLPLFDVDISGDRDAIEDYKLRGVPTLIMLNDHGAEINRMVGYKNKADLRAFLGDPMPQVSTEENDSN